MKNMGNMQKNILLVDDDEAHLLWSTELLKERGYSVLATHSAVAALDILKDTAYDLIISDLMMPEMSGSDFVRQVAAIRKGQKAIILTGHADVESFIETVHDLGALEYIVKPIEPADLIAMVNKLTSNVG